jgi:hypothetical protein
MGQVKKQDLTPFFLSQVARPDPIFMTPFSSLIEAVCTLGDLSNIIAVSLNDKQDTG